MSEGALADVLLGILISCDIALVAFVARRVIHALDKLTDKVQSLDTRLTVMETVSAMQGASVPPAL